MKIIRVADIDIDADTNIVINDTKPVKDRFYYGSRISKEILCYDVYFKNIRT